MIGWINSDGSATITDRWIASYSAPNVDNVDNIYNKEGFRVNNVTTIRFSRKANTGDALDLAFTNDQCLYLLFPFLPGYVQKSSGVIGYHEATPFVSPQPFCISQCQCKYSFQLLWLP